MAVVVRETKTCTIQTVKQLVEAVKNAKEQWAVDAIETAIVRQHCERLGLTPAGGVLKEQMTRGVDQNLTETLADVDDWSIDGVVMAFETLVPDEEAKNFGAVFTPEKITSFMVKETFDRIEQNAGRKSGQKDLGTLQIIDPAVGCGALLVAALQELVARKAGTPAEISRNLWGIDVSSDSLARARLLIELVCLSLGETEPVEPHLIRGNTLKDDLDVLVNQQKFDIILGNPPYVRLQQMPADLRKELATKWVSCQNGNFNLYFPFFEAAQKLCKTGGLVTYITPNGFFTSMSGKNLRDWLKENDWLDTIVDFGHHRVFDAMTYTAISFGTNRTPRKNPGFGYVDLKGVDELETLEKDWAKKRVTQVPSAKLTHKTWSLVGPGKTKAIEQILKTGKPLAELVEVRYGLATLRDRLYFLKGTRNATGALIVERNDVTFKIEEEATIKCVKVADIAQEADLDAVTSRIIYPYRQKNGKAEVVNEKELAETWPECWKYLNSIKPELAKRDHGRKTYATWYAYGRTQGLLPLGDKLLSPLYADKPRFMRDMDEHDLYLNGCGLTLKTLGHKHGALDLDVLQILLNSGLCHMYVEATANAISSGYYAYQKTQLSRFGIMEFTDEQVKELKQADKTAQDQLLAKWYKIVLPAAYIRN